MMPRWRRAAAIAAVILVQAVAAPAVLAADPTIGASAGFGPPGLSFTLTGSGYTPGTTYGVCILAADKTKCGFEGANLIGLEQFVAAADGTVPGGTTGAIPTLVAGSYHIVSTAPGTGFIVASTPFSVTAPTIALAPAVGAAGTSAVITVSGAAPGATYTVCIIPDDQTACGFVGIQLGDVQADASGSFPASTAIRVPGQAAGTYKVGLFVAGNNPTLFSVAAFAETTPSLTLSTVGGPGGTSIGVAGTGYGPGAAYELCLVPAGATQCGGIGILVGGFHAGTDGSIPTGTAAVAPTTAAGSYLLGIRLANSTPILIASSPFALAAGTVPPATTVPSSPLETTAPIPSAAPAGSGSDASGGVPWLLIIILLIVVLGLALWFSRRRRSDRPSPS